MNGALRTGALVVLLLTVACGEDATDPGTLPSDPPDSFLLEAPDTITEGQAFSMTVTALDAAGLPEGDWGGSVTLHTSAGSLSPSSIVLEDGGGTAEVTLSDAAGEVTLRAGSGGVESDSVSALVLSGQPPARIEIAPASALLTGEGETKPFEARVYDAAGALTTAQVSWTTSDSATVAIDDGGLATASAGLGSAMITASTNGVESIPALVLVAEPAGDPVLLDDEQITTLPEPVDPDADYGPGWQYRVRVQNAAVQAGDVVIGTGERPLAGRIVQSEEVGTETEVTVELVALSELFTHLEVEERIPLVEIEAVDATGGNAPSLLRGAEPGAGLAVGDTFRLGPFRCSYTTSLPSLNVDPAKTEVDQTLHLDVSYTDGLNRLVVGGRLDAEAAYRPVFQAVFEGSTDCETPPRTFTVPLGTISTMFFGIQVPLGIGFKLDGKLEVAEVGFDVGASATVDVELGLDCPGGGACSGVQTFEPTRDWRFEFVAPDPDEQFRVALGAHGYLWARPYLGSRFTSRGAFELIDAKAGLRQSLDLATTHYQVEDTAYASSFNLQFLADVAPGKDVQNAIQSLGSLLGVPMSGNVTLYTRDDTLARSPRGTFTISPEEVTPADSTEAGDTATFTVELDPVRYLGVESVDRVEFLWREEEDEDGSFALGPARPSCTEVSSDGEGQTSFECETDFLEEHEGEQTFHAFVHADLFGIRLPIPLEIGRDAKSTVHVGACTSPEDLTVKPPTITHDTMAQGSGGSYAWSVGPYDLGNIGVTMTATSEPHETGTPQFVLEVQAHDYICVQPQDSLPVDEELYLRVHVRGEIAVDPVNTEHGSSGGSARFSAGTDILDTHKGWGTGSWEEPGTLQIDEELLVPFVWSHAILLQTVVQVRALSSEGHPHAASGRVSFRIIGVENGAGEDVEIRTIRSMSGKDYLEDSSP